jgi:hypothetical protein
MGASGQDGDQAGHFGALFLRLEDKLHAIALGAGVGHGDGEAVPLKSGGSGSLSSTRMPSLLISVQRPRSVEVSVVSSTGKSTA